MSASDHLVPVVAPAVAEALVHQHAEDWRAFTRAARQAVIAVGIVLLLMAVFLV